MRLAGQDPYRYQKARFLGATSEMRIHLAARAHARDLARSSGELPARLAAIACNADLGPAERRAIIQALRAEVDTGTAGGRAQVEQISRFLADLDRDAGGARCPP